MSSSSGGPSISATASLGGGDDHVYAAGQGTRIFDGGPGTDTFGPLFTQAGNLGAELREQWVVDLEAGTAISVGGGGVTSSPITIINFENIDMEIYADGVPHILRGSDVPNDLTGNEGNDEIDGREGDDMIRGNGGDDIITGGPGADNIGCGDGIDTVTDASEEDLILADCEIVGDIAVNVTGDEPDADSTKEPCDVDEDTEGVQCTLRAAIETVNAGGRGDASNPRPISFDLGDGVEPTIAVESALPAIEVSGELDGRIGEDGKARIDGSAAGANADGLRLLGGGSRVHDMVVTGFGRDGIVIDGGTRARLGDNAVGTLADGTCPALCALGNGRSGVRIQGGATKSWVGDPQALTYNEKHDLRDDGEYVPGPNTIANNGDDAITIVRGRANDVAGNKMHDNGDLGIDLGADGLSQNDSRDIDSGPNDLLNAPTATSSFMQAEIGDRDIRSGRGIFSGTPNRDLRFVAYWLGGCDAPYAEEGDIPAYSYPFKTDEKGYAGLPYTKTDLGPGEPIAEALALAVVDSEGNTSELSNCVADDSDDDGIDDGFERKGADLDHDGEADVPLDRLGAVVGKADIFVEVDWTRGHVLDTEGLSRVQEAYADAPRENADGSTGVRLHIDNGRGSPLLDGGRWGADSRGGQVPATEAGYPLDGEWSGFDKVKAAHFDRDRAPFFRYALSVRKLYGRESDKTLGEARGTDIKYGQGGEKSITGTDFALGLGPFCSPAGSDCPGPVDAQAGGFMHELGHLLGLKHGGADDLENKPNFFSVMNYLYTAGTLLPSELPSSATAPILDYSRSGPPPGGGPGGTVATLDEENIDESAGIIATGAAASFSALKGCNSVSNPGRSLYVLVPKMNEPVDWDCVDGINPPYALDLNADGKYSKLATAPEWHRLSLFGGSVGGKYVQGGEPESPGDLSLHHFTETVPVLLGDEQAPEVRIETLATSQTEVRLQISASDDKQLDSLVVTVDGEQRTVDAVGQTGGNGGVNVSAVTDEVTLGPGTHLVSAVAFDRAMHQSDRVERAVTVGSADPDPTDPGPGDPGGPDSDNKVTGLKVTARKKQKQKGKKTVVKISVSAKEKVEIRATGRVKTRKPNRSYKLKPQTRTLKAGKRKIFKLVPGSKKDAKKIAKAIRKYKRAPRKMRQKLAVKVQVKVVATDAAGNKSAERRVVGLK